MLLLLFVLASLLSFFFQASDPNNPDIAPIIGLILARALQLTTIVKLVVDGVGKYGFSLSGPWTPVVACALGVALDFGVLAIGGGGFSARNCVMAVIAGVIAGVGAKVVTSVHEAVNP